MLKKYIQWQEERLAREDDGNKVVVPMEVGLGELTNSAEPQSLESLTRFMQAKFSDTESFFAQPDPPDYEYTDGVLRFASPVATETHRNNRATCNVFEARSSESAVIILPSWNSTGEGFDQLAGLISRFGITAVRTTLPYHESRRPSSMNYAEYMVSANLGRTIRSVRQAVLEVRLVIEWLRSKGYRKIGVVGASIGSTVAAIVSAHDQRVRSAAFMLLASDFADVVWTGRATRHIRQALEASISIEDVRTVWQVLSPISYVGRLARRDLPILIITGREDQVFQPHLTRRIIDALEEQGVRYVWREYSCGHYTLGTFPYTVFALIRVIRFLKRNS